MSDPATATISAATVREWIAPAVRAVEDFAHRSVDEWLATCGQYLDWHRANRLLQEAPPEVGRESDRVHAWLLRWARMLASQMRDPDFPHHEHPELEQLIRAYDAARESRGPEAEPCRAAFEARLEEALAQHPGLSRESLLNMIRLQHWRWLRARKNPPTLPPQA